MASVVFDKVSKTYPSGHKAVSDVSFSIAEHEFFVIVGPSGCGKSTLLRMVAGLEDISAGVINIGNRVINTLPPGRRNVSMVFQNYALFPHMSVFDNIAFGLKIRRVPKKQINTMVKDTADILGLSGVLTKRPKELSGGQRQRVALGRAIVRKPDVFLFDEPLSNLDAKLRAEMRTELMRIHTEFNTTALYVTHDQVEAMTLGDRICVLKDGMIQQIDTAENIYNKPANLFVGTFLGSPQMNVFKGTLIQKQGSPACRTGSTLLPFPTSIKNMPGQEGDTVFTGIRPEAMSLSPLPGTSAEIQGVVDMVEMIGGEALVHFTFENSRVTARTPAAGRPARGDTVRFFADPEALHVFDKTEKSVLAEQK